MLGLSSCANTPKSQCNRGRTLPVSNGIQRSAVETLGRRNVAVKGCMATSLSSAVEQWWCRGAVVVQGSSGGGEKQLGCREAVWLQRSRVVVPSGCREAVASGTEMQT